MSTWQADSDLGRYNRAPAGSRHPLPAGFAQVLDAALHVAQASGGALDPCAGRLVQHWGFGPGVDGHTPGYRSPGFVAPEAPPQGRPLNPLDPLHPAPHGPGAWAALHWDARQRQLTQPGGVQLDLCAIAKGFAVDQLSHTLHACGLPHHLVDVGGELRGAGLKPQGQPWWVDLEPPDTTLDARHQPWAQARLALHGLAVATSGDYRRAYCDAQGRWRSHTLDPRQGQPIAHGVASVSVVHPSAMWADAWSTALLVLGPTPGLALAEQHGLAARWLQRPDPSAGRPHWRCHESPAWQALKDPALPRPTTVPVPVPTPVTP